MYVLMVARRVGTQYAPQADDARVGDPVVWAAAGLVQAHGVDNFPAYVTVRLDAPEIPYGVVLHVQTSRSGSEVVGVVLALPAGAAPGDIELPSVARVIQDLQIDAFLALIRATLVLGAKGVTYADLMDSQSPSNVSSLNELQAALDDMDSFRRRSYRRRHGELLKEVAAVYIEAWNSGDAAPTKAVQMKVQGGNNGYSTANAWVRAARAAGLIPPATKGKAGWEELT